MKQLYKMVIFVVTSLMFIGFASIVNGQGEDPIEVRALAWSPDGTKIAVGAGPYRCDLEDADYSIRILDAQTGEVIDRWNSGHCTVTWVQWSGDGSKLLVTRSDGIAEIRNVASERIEVRSPRYSQPERVIDVWSPDGTRVANLSIGTPNLFIWDALTAETLTEMDSYGTLTIDWSPDSTRLVVGGSQARILDANSGQTMMTFSGNPSAVGTVDWSPDGTRIAGGGGGSGDDSSIHIWNASTGDLIQTMRGHSANVNRVVWSPDGNELASASSDGTVRIWDAQTGQELDRFTASGAVYTVDWSPDGSRVAFGGNNNDENIVLDSPALMQPTPTETPTSTPMPTETPTNTPTSTPSLLTGLPGMSVTHNLD
jgi:WD40 repeat protein